MLREKNSVLFSWSFLKIGVFGAQALHAATTK
jgi:hypothetical protein